MNVHLQKDRIEELADGALTGTDRESAEKHVESCETCRASFDLRRRNTVFLRERFSELAGAVQPNLEFLEAATRVAAVAEKPKEKAKKERRKIPAVVPAGIVVVLIAVAGFVLLGNGDVAEEGGDEGTGSEGVKTTANVTRPAPPENGDRRDPTPVPRPDEGRTPIVRPTAVRPGVATLLPRLLTSPRQPAFRALWTALADKPADAKLILRAFDEATEDSDRAVLALALAPATEAREIRDKLTAILAADGSPVVRRAAAAALGRVLDGTGGSVPVLRGVSVQAGEIKDEEVLRTLVGATETERDPSVIGALIRFLAPNQERDPTITGHLLELAASEEPRVRDPALEAIRNSPPRDPQALLRMIEDPQLPVPARAALVEAVRKVDVHGALHHLAGLARGAPEEEIRAAAVTELGFLPDKKGWDEVATALTDDPAVSVRAAALAIVAANMAHDKATAVLQQVAENDSEESLRKAAREVLRRKE